GQRAHAPAREFAGRTPAVLVQQGRALRTRIQFDLFRLRLGPVTSERPVAGPGPEKLGLAVPHGCAPGRALGPAGTVPRRGESRAGARQAADPPGRKEDLRGRPGLLGETLPGLPGGPAGPGPQRRPGPGGPGALACRPVAARGDPAPDAVRGDEEGDRGANP